MPAKRKRADDPPATVTAQPAAPGGRTTRSSGKVTSAAVPVPADPPKPAAASSTQKRVTRASASTSTSTSAAVLELKKGGDPVPTATGKRGRAGKKLDVEAVAEESEDEVMEVVLPKKKGGARAKQAVPAKKGGRKNAVRALVEDIEELDEVESHKPLEDPFPPYSPSRLLTLFSKYADEDDGDVMPASGIGHLCEDAGMSMEGVLPLLLAWQMEAGKMAEFGRKEWVAGMGALKCDTPQKIKRAMEDLEEILYGTKRLEKVGTAQEVYHKAKFAPYVADRDKAARKSTITSLFWARESRGS